MRILIVSDNIRKAEFVKKGLKFENLGSDLMSIDCVDLVMNYVSFYNGVILLSDNPSVLYKTAELCNKVSPHTPIIVLTGGFHPQLAGIRESSLVKMIFIRPYSFSGIASEMRYFIYQLKGREADSKLVLRDLELDLTRHEVRLSQKQIILRHREFALLHFLMMNTGKVLSRTTILENVWDRNASISTNTVDVHISQLRKKLEKSTDQKYIYTIPCSGYLIS